MAWDKTDRTIKSLMDKTVNGGIKHIAAEMGISLKKMAALMGISYGYLRLIMAGERTLSLKTLYTLAKNTEYSPEKLIEIFAFVLKVGSDYYISFIDFGRNVNVQHLSEHLIGEEFTGLTGRGIYSTHDQIQFDEIASEMARKLFNENLDLWNSIVDSIERKKQIKEMKFTKMMSEILFEIYNEDEDFQKHILSYIQLMKGCK